MGISSPLNAWRPKKTFVPSTAATTGATIAASAAAKNQRELQREEEIMTKYGADAIEGWEFKIVRASTRKFKDPQFFRMTCEEEARAGWEMLEKFDDNRIRFRGVENMGGICRPLQGLNYLFVLLVPGAHAPG